MHASRAIFATLKLHLKSRGLTYKVLAERLEISEPSVKRIFAEQNCTLDRLEEICAAAGCDLIDIARKSRAQVIDQHLSLEQEDYLASDAKRFVVFYLLLRGWEARDVMKRCGIDSRTLERILLDLEKNQLLELHPGWKVRLRVSSKILWRPDGPIFHMYHQQVKNEFLNAPFAATDSSYHFISGELSEHSRRFLKKRLEEVVTELQMMVEADADLDKKSTESIGLVLAYRPWIFSIFNGSTD